MNPLKGGEELGEQKEVARRVDCINTETSNARRDSYSWNIAICLLP